MMARTAAAVQPARVPPARGVAHDEHEADRLAASASQAAPAARRPWCVAPSSAAAGQPLAQAGAAVHAALAERGEPLPAKARSEFEPRFGHDLSRIRVHANDRADAAAASVGAHAFAAGSHLVFARNRYDPAGAAGRTLLAHELVHVLQQRALGPNPAAATVLQRQARPTRNLPFETPFLATVLSGDAVRADKLRRAALASTGQIEPLLWPEPNTSQPAAAKPIEPGSMLKISRVSQPVVIYADTGEWYPQGAGWLVVERGGQPAGFVLGVFMEPRATAKEVPRSNAPSSDKPVAGQPESGSGVRLVAEKLTRQQPLDFEAVVKAAMRGDGGPVSELSPAAERLLRSPKDKALVAELLAQRSPPIVFTVPLQSKGRPLQAVYDEWARANPLFAPPGAQVELRPSFGLLPQDQGQFVAVVTPVPTWATLFAGIVSAPELWRQLSPYLAPGVPAEKMKPAGDADVKRLGGIARNLNGLNPAQRKAFDTMAWQKMSGPEELESKLNGFVHRQQDITQLMATDPKELSGTRMDAMAERHRGRTPENAEIGTKMQALQDEQAGRQKGIDDARSASKATAAKVAEAGFLALDPNVQSSMLGQMLGSGFRAGAQYEMAPNAWKKISANIAANPDAFNLGTMAGLVPGAAIGIFEAVIGLVELAELLGKLGWTVAVDQFKDLVEPVLSPEKFRARKQLQAAKVNEVIDAVKAFAANMVKDPAFLSGPAFDIGLALGRSTGEWVNEFSGKSAFDQGEVVGEFIGRVVIEIVMLVAAPEEIAVRAAATASIKVGAEVTNAVQKLAKGIPALEKLMEAKRLAKLAKLGEGAVDAGKGVRTAEETARAARELEQGLAKGAKAEGRAAEAGGGVVAGTARAEPKVIDDLIRGGEGASKRLEPIVNKRVAAHLDEIRPSTVPGYGIEVPIEAEHTALRKTRGSWCVHSGLEVCNIPVSEQVEAGIDAKLKGLGLEVPLTVKQEERLVRVAEALRDESKWPAVTPKDRWRLGKVYDKLLEQLVSVAVARSGRGQVMKNVDITAEMLAKARAKGGRLVVAEGRIPGKGMRFDLLEIDFDKGAAELIDIAATSNKVHMDKTSSYKKALEALLGHKVSAKEMLYTGPDGKLLETLQEVVVP